ncbi:MAG TPA: hypothetical protein VIX81_09285, partial [Gammaproteobacteria bacterium]
MKRHAHLALAVALIGLLLSVQVQALTLEGFEPGAAAPGEQVALLASDLGEGGYSVSLGGLAATGVVVGADRVTFTVPDGALSGPVTLTAGEQAWTSRAELLVLGSVSVSGPGIADWSRYTVATLHGEDAGGAATRVLRRPVDHVTLVAATTDSSDPVLYAALRPSEQAVELTAESTALGILFQVPGIYAPYEAAWDARVEALRALS